MREPRARRPWAVAGLIVALACGGGDAPPDTTTAGDVAPAEGVYGVAPPAVGGTPSVVVLRPATPAAAGAGRGNPRMDQLGLTFTPPELMVMVGERVVFTNSETISHNVHVLRTGTDSTVLNVDTDPAGQADFVFEQEGAYDVTCDTHPGMRAFIYVTSSPYAVFADREGRFRISDVPSGSYTLSVWSVDPNLRSEGTVEVSGTSTEVTLGTR